MDIHHFRRKLIELSPSETLSDEDVDFLNNHVFESFEVVKFSNWNHLITYLNPETNCATILDLVVRYTDDQKVDLFKALSNDSISQLITQVAPEDLLRFLNHLQTDELKLTLIQTLPVEALKKLMSSQNLRLAFLQSIPGDVERIKQLEKMTWKYVRSLLETTEDVIQLLSVFDDENRESITMGKLAKYLWKIFGSQDEFSSFLRMFPAHYNLALLQRIINGFSCVFTTNSCLITVDEIVTFFSLLSPDYQRQVIATIAGWEKIRTFINTFNDLQNIIDCFHDHTMKKEVCYGLGISHIKNLLDTTEKETDFIQLFPSEDRFLISANFLADDSGDEVRLNRIVAEAFQDISKPIDMTQPILDSLEEILSCIELTKEICFIQNIMHDSSTFKDKFIKRCLARQTDQFSVNFYDDQNSKTNRFYHSLATIVLKKETLETRERTLHLPKNFYTLVCEDWDFLNVTRAMLRDLQRQLQNTVLQLPFGGIVKTAGTIPLTDLKHYVFSDSMCFDVRQIQGFNLNKQVNLYQCLKKEYPDIASKLYQHNDSLKAVLKQVEELIKLQNGEGCCYQSPRAAIQILHDQLGESHGLGEASLRVMLALIAFRTYLDELPESVRDRLMDPQLYTLSNILASLQPKLGEEWGGCKAIAAGMLQRDLLLKEDSFLDEGRIGENTLKERQKALIDDYAKIKICSESDAPVITSASLVKLLRDPSNAKLLIQLLRNQNRNIIAFLKRLPDAQRVCLLNGIDFDEIKSIFNSRYQWHLLKDTRHYQGIVKIYMNQYSESDLQEQQKLQSIALNGTVYQVFDLEPNDSFKQHIFYGFLGMPDFRRRLSFVGNYQYENVAPMALEDIHYYMMGGFVIELLDTAIKGFIELPLALLSCALKMLRPIDFDGQAKTNNAAHIAALTLDVIRSFVVEARTLIKKTFFWLTFISSLNFVTLFIAYCVNNLRTPDQTRFEGRRINNDHSAATMRRFSPSETQVVHKEKLSDAVKKLGFFKSEKRVCSEGTNMVIRPS